MQTVQDTMKQRDGKYLVYGGHGHSANYPMNKGVDQLLGIPALDFAERVENKMTFEADGIKFQEVSRDPGAYVVPDQKKADVELILPALSGGSGYV